MYYENILNIPINPVIYTMKLYLSTDRGVVYPGQNRLSRCGNLYLPGPQLVWGRTLQFSSSLRSHKRIEILRFGKGSTQSVPALRNDRQKTTIRLKQVKFKSRNPEVSTSTHYKVIYDELRLTFPVR